MLSMHGMRTRGVAEIVVRALSGRSGGYQLTLYGIEGLSMPIDWNTPDTAPSNEEVGILYEDARGRHRSRAKSPKGVTSWHDAKTGVEITQGRFLIGWMSAHEFGEAKAR